MTREEIHEEVLTLSKSHNNLLLEWATGVGKSFAAINLQDSLNAKTTYIVVAEVAHIKNWEDEYKKHGKEDLLKNTKIFCYDSLKKNLNQDIDLLVLDEAHRASTDIRLDYLSTIKADHVVTLSATISPERKSLLNSTFGQFKEYTITLSQAIEWGIIPKPKVYLIPLELNNIRQNHEIEMSRGTGKNKTLITCNYEDRWKYLKDKKNYPNLKLKIKCTEFQKNLWFNEQFDYYKLQYFRSRNKFLENKWLQIGSARKRFLAESKTGYATTLLKRLKDYRYICFCGSIEQAETLGKNVVHSKVKDSQSIIEKFNTKEISNLIVVNMLQMGQNLTDIEAGLIVQLDGQEISFIQKSGRVLRASEPIIFVLYYKNTRDEEYLEKIKNEINPEYCEVVTNIREFKF